MKLADAGIQTLDRFNVMADGLADQQGIGTYQTSIQQNSGRAGLAGVAPKAHADISRLPERVPEVV